MDGRIRTVEDVFQPRIRLLRELGDMLARIRLRYKTPDSATLKQWAQQSGPPEDFPDDEE